MGRGVRGTAKDASFKLYFTRVGNGNATADLVRTLKMVMIKYMRLKIQVGLSHCRDRAMVVFSHVVPRRKVAVR